MYVKAWVVSYKYLSHGEWLESWLGGYDPGKSFSLAIYPKRHFAQIRADDMNTLYPENNYRVMEVRLDSRDGYMFQSDNDSVLYDYSVVSADEDVEEELPPMFEALGMIYIDPREDAMSVEEAKRLGLVYLDDPELELDVFDAE